MKLTEDQYEIIEAYLANELSATDRASLERDLQTNTELREEIDRQRDIRLGLRALGIERALEQAKMQYKTTSAQADLVSASTNQTIVRPLINWRYLAVAASIMVVLGVGYYTYWQSTNRQADIAYAETFAPDPTNELVKDFPTGKFSYAAQTQFLKALRSYEAGKYDEVIEQLKTLPADKQTIYYKNYFLGLSYLANKQSAEAIPLLSKALTAPSTKLRQKAEWFLALAYVKNGQKERALPMLKRISTDKTHPFHSLAQQVLQKIS